jgi:hypothetical protein
MSRSGIRGYVADVWEAWNEFWFTPTSPSTLSAIRVLAGAMLLYTHAIWSLDLEAFFGPRGWLPPTLMHDVHQVANGPDGPAQLIWTYFDYIQSPTMLWVVHLAALAVFFLLMVGFFSRTMALLGYLIAVSYASRITPGAYFGLDKVNCMLALYLMLGPCGARYSLDRLWRLRRGAPQEVPPSVGANLAIRLIQLHMCIIYLFSGIAKLQGETWWAGNAIWYSVASLEYQSIDLTWLVKYPWLINLITHATVIWELSYCALVWPRLTRPWVLLFAVLVHGGIAIGLGMATFGLAMLIGNLAFISPGTVRRWADPIARRIALLFAGGGAGQGGAASPPRPVGAMQ